VSDAKITLVSTLSRNIFLDSEDLNSNILIYKSDSDISNFQVHSSCDIDSYFLSNYKNIYFFEIKYKNNKCINPNLVLKYEDNIFSETSVKLNLLSS
jgi:hypothetical protein